MQNFCLTIEMIIEYELKNRIFIIFLAIILQITSILCGDLLKRKLRLRFHSLTVARFGRGGHEG